MYRCYKHIDLPTVTILLLVFVIMISYSSETVFGDLNNKSKKAAKEQPTELVIKKLQNNRKDIIPEHSISKSAILSLHNTGRNHQDSFHNTQIDEKFFNNGTLNSFPMDISTSNSLSSDSQQHLNGQRYNEENLSGISNTEYVLSVGNNIFKPSNIIYANCEIHISQLPADAETSLACHVAGASSEDKIIATNNTPSSSYAIASAFSINPDEVDINIKNLDHKKQISGDFTISLILFR